MAIGILVVVVGDDRQHRAEDLLLGDGHRVVDVGEDGRLHVVAGVETLGLAEPAGHDTGALVDALLDVALDAVPLGLRDERTHVHALLGRRLDLHRLGGGRGDGNALLVAGAGEEHAGVGGAGLAVVEVGGEHAAADGGGVVLDVVEDDVGRLAAELEGNPLDGAGGHLGHPLAGSGRTGERDHVDVGVGGDALADLGTGAHDHVEHAGRQADVVDDLGQDVGVERCDLGRLQHDGAAGGEGATDLAHDLVERVVPRRDAADDTDRLLDDQAVADRLLPLDLAEQVGVALHVHGGEPGLDHGGPGDRHADLAGDRLGDLGSTGHEALVEALEVLLALLDVGLAPGAERRLRRGHGLVDVGGDAVGDAAHDFLGRRVDHVDGAGTLGGDPGPVDVDLVVLAHVLCLMSLSAGGSPPLCHL